jgi:Tol biopolymer transport system component
MGATGRIVLSSNRAGGNLELFVMEADGSAVRRLTTTEASEVVPAWSPDGTQIAFASFADDFASLDPETSPGQVMVMRADGSAMQALTRPAPRTGAITWSPDGQWLAFEAEGDIDVMRPDGSQRRTLADTQSVENWPSWSPDGDEILVTSSSPGPGRLATIRADGSDTARLQQLGYEAAWSPDGRRIAFVSARDGEPAAKDPVDWNEEIYVTTPDGADVTRITRIPGNDHWPPTWSPDGTHIAFTSDGCDNSGEIFVADARGTGRIWNVSKHPAHDFFPSWQR